MTTIYDKFMIDNPPDNHFDKMKLNGLFINTYARLSCQLKWICDLD